PPPEPAACRRSGVRADSSPRVTGRRWYGVFVPVRASPDTLAIFEGGVTTPGDPNKSDSTDSTEYRACFPESRPRPGSAEYRARFPASRATPRALPRAGGSGAPATAVRDPPAQGRRRGGGWVSEKSGGGRPVMRRGRRAGGRGGPAAGRWRVRSRGRPAAAPPPPPGR